MRLCEGVLLAWVMVAGVVGTLPGRAAPLGRRGPVKPAPVADVAPVPPLIGPVTDLRTVLPHIEALARSSEQEAPALLVSLKALAPVLTRVGLESLGQAAAKAPAGGMPGLRQLAPLIARSVEVRERFYGATDGARFAAEAASLWARPIVIQRAAARGVDRSLYRKRDARRWPQAAAERQRLGMWWEWAEFRPDVFSERREGWAEEAQWELGWSAKAKRWEWTDAFLGVDLSVAGAGEDFWARLGLRLGAGLRVEAVQADSSAADAELLPGDVITHLGTSAVASREALNLMLLLQWDRREVPVHVRRGDQAMVMNLFLPKE